MQEGAERDKGNIRLAIICGLISLLLFLLIPLPNFDNPRSTVVQSSDGQLLGAHIASDGQWRFPSSDSLPDKYLTALINFEDRWYYQHPGINPVSIFRSLIINIRSRRIVSGGSTITMQVARLSGNNPPRTVSRKLLEIMMALKTELLFSKNDILEMYAANAPFGGNVVGIEAASWRYFGRTSMHLSWAEASLLAVLPNAPSLLYPGKNDTGLLTKRNRLLSSLYTREEIDSLTYILALEEPLPESLHSLPRLAPAISDRLYIVGAGERHTTTIEYNLQNQVVNLAKRSQEVNSRNGINNIAALVVELETGNILAYAGNVTTNSKSNAGEVDMIRAPRSTGSILKPLLYAGMLESGEIMPDMLIRDVPVEFSGYSPKNFDLNYRGAVKASVALSKSLNIPAVEMLRVYTPDRFLHLLNGLGLSTFPYDADHYGLSLILGGGEATLLELTGLYARMGYTLKHYDQRSPLYPDYTVPKITKSEGDKKDHHLSFPLSAGSIWTTFEALKEVNRPGDYSGWKNFSSSDNIAWKTGTSFGFRDGWAIAICPDYAIGVWAGNADGEGRTGLTGVGNAAPLLFDIIDLLSPDNWFSEPLGDLMAVNICSESGHRASENCENTELRMVPLTATGTGPCPYHINVHLSSDEKFRVNEGCYDGKIIEKSWFVLPPAQEWFYRKSNYDYNNLPPFIDGCEPLVDIPQIELLYPRNLGGIYVPVENDGRRGKVVFEAAHRNSRERLFWHLDDKFIGETGIIHQMGLNPEPGIHLLTILDEKGNTFSTRFTIIDK